ncbi:MAG TPA: tetratricopeptide repeat protein [Gemmatimonadales bacterium]|nr:tetratricopeptide repeat protein [Gemmatimonadales bacterium]
MTYWKGLLIAVVFDVAWIMGSPLTVTGPEIPVAREVMNPEPGVPMPTSPEDAQLDAAGRLEDSLMMYLQAHETDAAAMVSLARMYVEHGWYDAAIGPLARALELDPERRGAWSLLDRALKMTGMAKITDAELAQRAKDFVDAVDMWGHGC